MRSNVYRLFVLWLKTHQLLHCHIVGTEDGEDELEQGSVVREFQQDDQNAGRKLSAKTIKAILELICDEAVSKVFNINTV